MSWMQEHLETFVKPHLGYIPTVNSHYFTDGDMRLIKNVWKSVKRRTKESGKTLLLGGRDTWVFEVLARRENFPTVYVPNLSRVTKYEFKYFDIEKFFMFDTGFEGSIPISLGLEYCLMSHNSRNIGIEVFPNNKVARQLAIKIERSPKYFESARVIEGQIFMKRVDNCEFEKAALLTQEIYRNSTQKGDNSYGRHSLSNQGQTTHPPLYSWE